MTEPATYLGADGQPFQFPPNSGTYWQRLEPAAEALGLTRTQTAAMARRSEKAAADGKIPELECRKIQGRWAIRYIPTPAPASR